MAVRTLPGGRLVANGPARLLIMNAFGMQRSQIIGGPVWVNRERYEIEAKSEGNADRNQLMAMLQTLLEDRFRMSTHRENRETPAYALVIDENRLRLSPSKEEGCAARSSVAANRYEPAPSECGHMLISASGAAVHMSGDQVSIPELVRALAVALDRPVIDETNLSGTFDMKLDFVDEDSVKSATDLAGPALSVALRQQLGLKLEAIRGHIDFLVIDYIERPTEN